MFTTIGIVWGFIIYYVSSLKYSPFKFHAHQKDAPSTVTRSTSVCSLLNTSVAGIPGIDVMSDHDFIVYRWKVRLTSETLVGY